MQINLFFIRIFILLLIFSIGGGYVAACSIEKSPPTELVAYQKNIQAEVTRIKTLASRSNLCNGAIGTFSTERRFAEFFQTIGTRSLYSQDLITDFRYNILVVAEGNSKGPVVNQGAVLEGIEQRLFSPAIKNAIGSCTLDMVDPSNGITLKVQLSRMIEYHRDLLAYYKSVVVGNKVIPTGLEGDTEKLYGAIRKNYSPEITASCKAGGGGGSTQDLVATIQEKIKNMMQNIQNKAKNTNDSQNDWEKAIALFSGKGGQTKAYSDLQQRLLSAELARQGLTGKARDSMLKKLSCIQQRTTPGSNIEEIGKANYECGKLFDTITENVTAFVRGLIVQSKTTDQFIERTRAYDRSRTRLGIDMGAFWQEVQNAKNSDEKLNEKTITDLVNIHAQLVGVNDLLEKKGIPKMRENCMKGSVDVKGACWIGQ